jgi:hypothetical protein
MKRYIVFYTEVDLVAPWKWKLKDTPDAATHLTEHAAKEEAERMGWEYEPHNDGFVMFSAKLVPIAQLVRATCS